MLTSVLGLGLVFLVAGWLALGTLRSERFLRRVTAVAVEELHRLGITSVSEPSEHGSVQEVQDVVRSRAPAMARSLDDWADGVVVVEGQPMASRSCEVLLDADRIAERHGASLSGTPPRSMVMTGPATLIRLGLMGSLFAIVQWAAGMRVLDAATLDWALVAGFFQSLAPVPVPFAGALLLSFGLRVWRQRIVDAYRGDLAELGRSLDLRYRTVTAVDLLVRILARLDKGAARQ